MEEQLNYTAETGGESGEFTAPQTEEESTSFDGAEDTAGESGADEQANADTADQQEEQQDERTSKQPPEVDAAFAQMRRENEQLKRQLEDYNKWVADKFGKTHGIQSLDQYRHVVESQLQQQQTVQQQHFEQQQQNQLSNEVYQLRQQGYDDAFINMHVRTRQAEQRVERIEFEMRQREEAARYREQEQQKQSQQQQILKKLTDDHAALAKKYPGLHVFGKDINETLQKNPDLYNHLAQNPEMSLKAAFFDLYEDTIADYHRKGGKQAALNNVNGKSHLRSEGQSGKELEVMNLDPDELARFRSMFPQMKDQDFAYFKKHGKLPKRR